MLVVAPATAQRAHALRRHCPVICEGWRFPYMCKAFAWLHLFTKIIELGPNN